MLLLMQLARNLTGYNVKRLNSPVPWTVYVWVASTQVHVTGYGLILLAMLSLPYRLHSIIYVIHSTDKPTQHCNSAILQQQGDTLQYHLYSFSEVKTLIIVKAIQRFLLILTLCLYPFLLYYWNQKGPFPRRINTLSKSYKLA